jgi:hypothetical protein
LYCRHLCWWRPSIHMIHLHVQQLPRTCVYAAALRVSGIQRNARPACGGGGSVCRVARPCRRACVFVRSSDVDADLCVASLALGDVRRRCEWWWHRILSVFAPSRESEMGWDEGSLLLLLFLMLKRRFSMTCWSFGLGSISWSWMMFLVGLEGCGAKTQ